MREYALVLLVTAAVTYLLTPLVRRVAVATHAMHEPRARDTHTTADPAARRPGHVRRAGRRAAHRQPAVLPAGSLPDGRVEERSRAAAGRRARGRRRVRRRPVGAQRRSASWPARWPRPASWSGAARRCPGCRLPNGGVFSLEPDLSVTLTILHRRGHHQRDQLHRRPRRARGRHRGRRRAVVPGLLVHADPDHRHHLAVAARGGVRAAGRHVPRVPAAQLLPGADLHGRHRRHAARPAARLRADIQHRFARPGPADQLRQHHALDRFPTFLPLLVPGRDLHHPVRGPDVRGHPADPGRQAADGRRPAAPASPAAQHRPFLPAERADHVPVGGAVLGHRGLAVDGAEPVRSCSPLATVVAVLALLPATMPRLRPWRAGRPEG